MPPVLLCLLSSDLALLPDERLRAAVHTAEGYADNDSLASTLVNARRQANRAWRGRFDRLTPEEKRTSVATTPSLIAAAVSAASAAAATSLDDAWYATSSHYLAGIAATQTWHSNNRCPNELLAQTGLLRDIFGNPFKPVAVEPAWMTWDVNALAEGMYQERAFDRMSILAEALQDAGCDNEDVLSHCRGDGPHVRGCWVVDMILGTQ